MHQVTAVSDALWLQVLNVAGALYASGEDHRPEKERFAGQSALDIIGWLSCSLPAVLFLGVNNSSTVQPVVSISLQAAKLDGASSVHARKGAGSVQASQERAVFYRERAAGTLAPDNRPA